MKIVSEIIKDIKNIVRTRDKKIFIKKNLPYLIFFYLYEEFDYMIDELVNNGVIKENNKELELSEYVVNVVSDVNVEEVEGKNVEIQSCKI